MFQAMSGLVALQHLSLTGCSRVQGDALTALATLTALRCAPQTLHCDLCFSTCLYVDHL